MTMNFNGLRLRKATAIWLTTVIISFLLPSLAHTQDTTQEKAGSTTVQFPNNPIPVILLEYERLTNKRIIRDVSIQDKRISIQTSGPLTRQEAAEFIEQSLLLNGYAFVPTEDPNVLKIIAYGGEKSLRSEALPIITRPIDIPGGEEVISYIMPLDYLSSEAAAELFTTVVDLHGYGKITPLENSQAVVITENSSVVRRLVELQTYLDVRPVKSIDQLFALQRADAEEVAAALTEILGLSNTQNTNTSANSPLTNRPPLSRANGGANGGGNAPNGGQAQLRRAFLERITAANAGAAAQRATAAQAKIQAVPRSNSILVVAAPSEIDYIARLIAHLDGPSTNANYLRRRLKYVSVSDFLRIAGDVLQKGDPTASGQSIQGGGSTQGGNTQTGGSNTNRSGLGSGGSGGAGGTISFGNAGADAAAAPESLVVGKTLLIADNVQNMLIASGPPENLQLLEELLDSMDVRPQQIQISAIIAQLNLGNDFEFGVDFLRTFDGQANGELGNVGGSFKSRTGQSQNLLDLAGLGAVSGLLPAAQGLTMYGQVNPHLDIFLSALDSTNRFKVLSRPTIYTVNNRQAIIQTGQRIAVPRSTLSSVQIGGNNNPNQVVTANIDFENVVLEVSVLPLINADGEITLQIQQRNDDITGSQLIGGDEIPTIGTQALGTTVMVRDGGTVMLGGLITEEDRKTESGLPLFTNIPLLGRVVGSTRDNLARQELIIFIQPRIIRNETERWSADLDLANRTAVAIDSYEFARGEVDNIDVFNTQDFHSPEKRVHFLKRLFQRKKSNERALENEQPPLRAEPVIER